ncbi:MAG: acetolactate synthase small subunit [Patescibacteria group bacterium]|nr:acetolactate synthase small subunit [Candidatus Neomarinimicrobiota bacterium]MEA3357151.1 acetolactate synthase small subunit [Patescibacteria group bacterium]
MTETGEKIEQISKQLNKLVDVLKVTDISHNKDYIVREFIMVKISTSKNRPDLLQLIDLFRAKVLDLATNYVVISLTGAPRKIQRFIEVVQPYGIQELD